MGQKELKIGLDLDGVIAKHSLGGFWVRLRKIKEKFLKKIHNHSYFYPKTVLEINAWKIINWLRIPDKDGVKQIIRMKKEGWKFFLITGRFNFNNFLTVKWLKKYHLYDLFDKVLVNVGDEDPILFKSKQINKNKIDFFADDDLEVLHSFKTDCAKLYWVVPGHRNGNENGHKQITSCASLYEALVKMDGNSSKITSE